MDVKKAITVNRSPEDLYQFWHDFENLPRFMQHLESVRVTGERRSHWKATAPTGKSVEWDAVTTRDIPNELIA
ncbi:MAG TPA: SRPBCC family protein, partial [Chloroflexota bacterium]|nr:SRPBCC family protein [Chloroflexota bacterium]